MKIKTKSKKVNRAWLNDHVNDTYVKLAQKEGYRARAAYKLKEIDESLGLVKPGYLVVDLGSAPVAWSRPWPAAKPTWWCPTWRPTCRESRRRTPPVSPIWSSWPSSFRWPT